MRCISFLLPIIGPCIARHPQYSQKRLVKSIFPFEQRSTADFKLDGKIKPTLLKATSHVLSRALDEGPLWRFLHIQAVQVALVAGLGQGERAQNLTLGGQQQNALQALLQGQQHLSQYRKPAVQASQLPNYASTGFNYSQVRQSCQGCSQAVDAFFGSLSLHLLWNAVCLPCSIQRPSLLNLQCATQQLRTINSHLIGFGAQDLLVSYLTSHET